MKETTDIDLKILLATYKMEVGTELENILRYWQQHVADKEQGGFFGAVNNNNTPDRFAPKGVVMNSRILWAFSAAFNQGRQGSYVETATRAFAYINDHFIDREYGGAFWSVDHTGKCLDGKKQIYGLAFCIYGLAEYYKATRESIALDLAKDLFAHVERHSLDKEQGGYIEAFTRDWKIMEDLRLSDKDDNEKKTMNTHLHLIEAYANLYTAWPDALLRQRIIGLLDIFDRHIIDKRSHHLHLFMDATWEVRSSLQSYGHDIEGAWLLPECAGIAGDANAIEKYKEIALRLAEAAREGLDTDGGLWYEFEASGGHLLREKHSWPQAEAMVGFLNAWQLGGDERFLRYSMASWEFVKKHICDRDKGEWLWGVDENYAPMAKDKAGFWKCPYHNVRACLEVMRRIA